MSTKEEFLHRRMLDRQDRLGRLLKIRRKKELVAAIDALQVQVQCLESWMRWQNPDQCGAHAGEKVRIRMLPDEAREAYYVEKLATMVTLENENANLRNVLRAAMARPGSPETWMPTARRLVGEK